VTKGVGRLGVSASVDVQVALDCDTDRRMAETLAYDLDGDANPNADATAYDRANLTTVNEDPTTV
jgi:hypothetical protein